jgi:hypothetical protein
MRLLQSCAKLKKSIGRITSSPTGKFLHATKLWGGAGDHKSFLEKSLILPLFLMSDY